jgi:predicted nucleic acid-binding OB-fold protein
MYSDEQPDEYAALDIFLPDDKTLVKGLTFRTVTDSIVLNDNPFSTVIMNRRGIQFEKLTDRLKSELEYIIQILAREDLETGCPIYNIRNLARLSV